MTPTLAGRVAHPEGTQWQPMPTMCDVDWQRVGV